MRIVFLGAEKPSARSFLISSGATDLGLGFAQLKNHDLRFIPEEVNLHLHPGSVSPMSPDEWEDFSAEYQKFIEANAERFATITELYLPGVDAKTYDDIRKSFYNHLDEKVFRPVWRDNASLFELESMSEDYPHVTLSRQNAIAANRERPSFLYELSNLAQCEYSAFGFHRPKQGAYGYRLVYSTAWKSVVRMGQTIIFTGRSLIRVNKERAEDVRTKHAGVIQSYGLDPQKVIDGDAEELTTLAVYSLLEYQRMVERLPSAEYVPDNSGHDEYTEDGQEPQSIPDHSDAEPGNVLEQSKTTSFQSNGTSMRVDPPRVVPVIELVTKPTLKEDGNSITVSETTVTASPQETVRRCDICALARTCPAFVPRGDCSFNLPVELRTAEQVEAFNRTLLEMQAARIAFGRFAEELAGGMPDKELSAEMDRYFKILRDLKKLNEVTERASITMEKRTSTGVLSSLFGKQIETGDDDPPLALPGNPT